MSTDQVLMLTDASGRTGYAQMFGRPLPPLRGWTVEETAMPALDDLSAGARRLILAAAAARCAWHMSTGLDSAGAPLHGVEVWCGGTHYSFHWNRGRLTTYGRTHSLRDAMTALAAEQPS
jgi:hypothetical protein